jgi:putative Mg2+ transporter-C (MgtC) family protein
MGYFPDNSELQIIFQMLLAAVLGGLIGMEREVKGKSSGLRTFAFVAMGSALFTILSIHGFNDVGPSRVASNILTGVGFLGAGVIFRQEERVRGITTAAGLWLVAAIGMAVGCGFYTVAIFGAAICLISFIFLRRVDEWIHNKAHTDKEL